MSNKKECAVVQDLLPLYVDNMVKEETKDFVEKHLEACDECKVELDNLKDPITVEKPIVEAAEVIEAKEIKKSISLFKRIQWVKGGAAVLFLVVFLYSAVTMYHGHQMDRLTSTTWQVNGENCISFDEFNRAIFGEAFDAAIKDNDPFDQSLPKWEGYGSYSVSWSGLNHGSIFVNNENMSMQMSFKFSGGKLVLGIYGKDVVTLEKAPVDKSLKEHA